MNFKEFLAETSNSKNEDNNTNWLKLKKDESVKVIIPQKTLGMFKALYIQGVNNKSQTLRLTDETYKLLLEHNAVPIVKNEHGSSPKKPQIRAFINVIDLSANQVKVWETSKSTIQRLLALDEDVDTPPLSEMTIKITKRSKGPTAKDVEIDIQNLGKAVLTEDQKKLYDQLYNVELLAQAHSREYILKFIGEDEIPF